MSNKKQHHSYLWDHGGKEIEWFFYCRYVPGDDFITDTLISSRYAAICLSECPHLEMERRINIALTCMRNAITDAVRVATQIIRS